MIKNLRNAFNLRADFKPRHALIITGLLLALAVLAELNYKVSYAFSVKRILAPVLIAVILTLCLTRVVVAISKRLLRVIEESTVATKHDLLLIGFAYFFVIVGFGVLYLVLETFTGKPIFDFTDFQARIRLIDNLYLSGITITTGGNVLPVYWFSKGFLVIESLLGVWLTAIVLGFFIGSLLGSQQQVKQAQWYADLQKYYVPALEHWANAVATLENELDSGEPETILLKIRDGRQKLLETVAGLVEYQYDPIPSARVQANWMQFYPAANAPPEYLELARPYTSVSYVAEGDMKKLAGVLVMREWGKKPDNMPGNEELVIPVYDANNEKERLARQLRGAPLAVVQTSGLDIVSDSVAIDLSNQDQEIRTKFANYFTDHRAELGSFASVRISKDATSKIEVAELSESALPLAVMNIQSSQPYLLGPTERFQATLVDMIKPFGRYLGRLILCEITISTEHANGSQ